MNKQDKVQEAAEQFSKALEEMGCRNTMVFYGYNNESGAFESGRAFSKDVHSFSIIGALSYWKDGLLRGLREDMPF